MTKGNKTRLILTVITLGLLPFSFFVTKALYLQVGEDININISGSLETNTYSVNLYMPDGNGNYTLSNTYDIDTSSDMTINDVITNNNIRFNPINNYIYNGHIYNNDSIETTYDLTSLIKSSIDLYPEYVGYFVQGYSELNLSGQALDMYQLEINEDTSSQYNFNSNIKLDGKSAEIKEHIYSTSTYNVLEDCNYNNLVTNSGYYRISLDTLSEKFSSNFSRIIDFAPNSNWEKADAVFYLQYYEYNVKTNSWDYKDIRFEALGNIFYNNHQVYRIFLAPHLNTISSISRRDPNNLSKWRNKTKEFQDTNNFDNSCFNLLSINYSKDSYLIFDSANWWDTWEFRFTEPNY